MKIACIGYRDWSLNIYSKLKKTFPNYDFLIQGSKEQYNEVAINEYSPDLILFYGWSNIVTKNIIEKYYCLMLHPSPLPYYRGGSPIQNQIIRGEVDSAVTIFRMDDGIDTGPIVKQQHLSLDGSLDEIFNRIEVIGFNLTREFLIEGINIKEQDHSLATYYPRLTPDRSEITLKELAESPSSYLRNKIRMLQDPYPNPYIKTCDGKKLVIKVISIEN